VFNLNVQDDVPPPPVDSTPPLFVSAYVNGNELTLEYNEALNDFSNPAGSSFTVMVNGQAVEVTSANALGSHVFLTLKTPVTDSQTVTVSYTPPASSPTEDQAGNDAAAFSNAAVQNRTPAPPDTTPPVLQTASVNGNTLTLTYNEALNAASDAAPSSFVINVNGSPVTVNSVNAGGTAVVLSLAAPVLFGQTVTVSYTPPASNPTEDVAGNDAVALSAVVVNNVTSDVTPPAAPSLALASDTGSSSSDGITNNGQITVTGLESGASWEYTTDSGSTWTAGTGNSFTLAAGTYAAGAVQARQTDAAGNLGSAGSTASAITVDSTAPATPTLDLAAISDTGSANSDNITNDTALTFDLTFEDGALVTLFNDVNDNGIVDSGEVLAASTFTGSTSGNLTSSVLAEGIYTNSRPARPMRQAIPVQPVRLIRPLPSTPPRQQLPLAPTLPRPPACN